MKRIILFLALLVSASTFAQVQYGGYSTENGSKFTFSTVNSTTAQLASGATFTGTVESVTNQRSYSFLFVSDQNATITINQFIDAGGTKNIQQLVFSYTANGKFSRSGVLNGNYVQVIIQNTGGSTTTTLTADMAYGNIDPSTQLNNIPYSLMEVNGTAASVSSGATDAGTQRVMLANESIQDLYFSGQATQTATINNIIPSTASSSATDLIGYRSGSVQLICPTGTYTTGAVIFEGSNDNTNFQTIPVYSQLILTGTPITAAITLVSNTNLIYTFPINCRYIRVRISTAVSGASASVTAYSKFSQQNWTPAIFQIAQATAANLNVTPASTPLMTGAIASAAAADATANPTGAGFRMFPFNFNSSTWDRPYNNYNTTTGDEGAKTASFNGATQTNFNARGALITVLCGTVTGTTPTLNARLQWSPDAGTTWISLGAASADVTATGNTIVIGVYPTGFNPAGAVGSVVSNTATAAVFSTAVLPRTWRLTYNIGGTTPSFTITGVYVNYIN